MKARFKPLILLALVGASCITLQVSSVEPAKLKLTTAVKRIDLTNARLLLEMSRVEVVSKHGAEFTETQARKASCGGSSTKCDDSEEDPELEARRFDERWWQDERGDEWYERTEFHKHQSGEWVEVGSGTIKEGGDGFVARPKG